MDKLIAICNYGNGLPKENVYVNVDENECYRWYDSMGMSDDYYYSEREALDAFIEFMESENQDCAIMECI